ncbi:MAG: hypothetical protein JW849_11060 [Phycisphaerae bacterium]|nr:hypothetical protein [Phycisphaerae bacterium]
MKITPEQFEDMLLGRCDVPESLPADARETLKEHRILRARLGRISAAMPAPAGLSDRVRARLAPLQPTAQTATRPRGRIVGFLISRAPILAAACLILAVGVWTWRDGTPQARAAQPTLYEIHQADLAGQNDFLASDNPAEIAQRLQRQAHMNVNLPAPGDSCEYLGSTLAKFRSRTVGGVLCRYQGQAVSVLCISDPPETLGFRHRFERNGQTWWRCGYSGCAMVAVGQGGGTYIAVGRLAPETLMDLLERIVNHNHTPTR